MNKNIIIRPAKTEDIPQMCGLLSELFSMEADFSPDMEKQAAGIRMLIADKPGSLILVAETNSRIIGMCSVQTLISTAEGGVAGLLEDLVVSREHRCSGVGTLLISEIMHWCKINNILRLQLLADNTNAGALEFYKKTGWENTRLICLRTFP